MSPVVQYVLAVAGLLLLGGIHGALNRIAHDLGRIALSQERGAEAVERAAKCPDYPPVR